METAEIIELIVFFTKDALTVLMPVIGVMAGITFIVSFLFSVTVGAAGRMFKK